MDAESYNKLAALAQIIEAECKALDWDNTRRQRWEAALADAQPVLDMLATMMQ